MHIFVSYRQTDTGTIVQRVQAILTRELVGSSVFVAERSLPPGPFPEKIDAALRGAQLVLLLIGPNWLEAIQRRRLQVPAEQDWVRREIRYALRSETLIIPVTVGGARFVRAFELPEDLRGVTHFQASKLDEETLEADLATLASRVRQLNLPPVPARTTEAEELRRARDFVTSIRHDWQARGLDFAASIQLAVRLSEHADKENELKLDATARELVETAYAFHDRFRGLDHATVYRLREVCGLNNPSLQSERVVPFLRDALRDGSAKPYALENTERVLRAIETLCLIPGERFSDDWIAAGLNPARPPDTDLLVVWKSEREQVAAGAIGPGHRFREIGTYAARSAQLRWPQIRAPEDDEPRLYTIDHRTIYRWNLSERLPEMEWRLPHNPERVDGLRVLPRGPIEFLISDGQTFWAKLVGQRALLRTELRPSRHGGVFADENGDPTRWVDVEWSTGEDPATTLTVVTWRLGGNGSPERREIRLDNPIRMHEGLLPRDGKHLGGTVGVYPDVYQGYDCALLVNQTHPRGAAIFFIDLATGHSLRTPAIVPRDVVDPRIVRSAGRDYLLCQALSEGDSVFIFDVSNNLQLMTPERLSFGAPSRSTGIIPLTPTRFLIAFERSIHPEYHDEAPYIGSLDFATTPPTFDRICLTPDVISSAAQLGGGPTGRFGDEAILRI